MDKLDLKRYSDFVLNKTYDMLAIAQATATANGRDVAELGLDVETFLRDLESEDHRHTGPHDTETLARSLGASRHRSGVARGG